MIDKTYWKIAFDRDPQGTFTELMCKFFLDPAFRNEVLDSIPEDKMEEMKETYLESSKFKNLTFEEWLGFFRLTGIIIPSA